MMRSYPICAVLLLLACDATSRQQRGTEPAPSPTAVAKPQPGAQAGTPAPGAAAPTSDGKPAGAAAPKDGNDGGSASGQPGGTGKGNPFARSVEAVVEGRKLYLQYGCAACHGMSGGGGMGRPILDDEWVFGSDDETLFKLMRGQVPKQTMPNAIGQVLTDEQIWKILVYVRYVYQGDPKKINWVAPPQVPPERLTGPVAGAVDPVAAGKVLFMAACAPCHGQQGKGDGPNSKELKPKPRNLTDASYMRRLDDRYLFEIISRGGIAVGKSPQMPEFVLPPEDIQNVIAYIKTLSAPASR